jgi:hypothetical protein
MHRSNKHANVLLSYNYQLSQQNIFKQKNKYVTINDIDDTTLYHETVNVQLRPSSDLSDIFQVFRRTDILGVQQTITGFGKPDFCEEFSIHIQCQN